jgi:hypothetical protein
MGTVFTSTLMMGHHVPLKCEYRSALHDITEGINPCQKQIIQFVSLFLKKKKYLNVTLYVVIHSGIPWSWEAMFC